MTIDDVIDEMRTGKAKSWQIVTANTESFICDEGIAGDDNADMETRLQATARHMSKRPGKYVVYWSTKENARNGKTNPAELEIPAPDKTSSAPAVSAIGYSNIESLKTFFNEQNKEVNDLRIEMLKKDFELTSEKAKNETNRETIDDLKKQIRDLEQRNRDLEDEGEKSTIAKIEKFANIAGPYLQAFLSERKGISTSVASAENNTDMENYSLNIPDSESDRFVELINRWSAAEPDVVNIIEKIVILKENEPATYAMALGMLTNR